MHAWQPRWLLVARRVQARARSGAVLAWCCFFPVCRFLLTTNVALVPLPPSTSSHCFHFPVLSRCSLVSAPTKVVHAATWSELSSGREADLTWLPDLRSHVAQAARPAAGNPRTAALISLRSTGRDRHVPQAALMFILLLPPTRPPSSPSSGCACAPNRFPAQLLSFSTGAPSAEMVVRARQHGWARKCTRMRFWLRSSF
ncbi:hypothetical protein BC567DRAFT_96432 [Phyllosticta citribraziliensis]